MFRKWSETSRETKILIQTFTIEMTKGCPSKKEMVDTLELKVYSYVIVDGLIKCLRPIYWHWQKKKKRQMTTYLMENHLRIIYL